MTRRRLPFAINARTSRQASRVAPLSEAPTDSVTASTAQVLSGPTGAAAEAVHAPPQKPGSRTYEAAGPKRPRTTGTSRTRSDPASHVYLTVVINGVVPSTRCTTSSRLYPGTDASCLRTRNRAVASGDDASNSRVSPPAAARPLASGSRGRGNQPGAGD
ncbi:hypothetical protein STPH1_6283 [Streptomyces sp. OM5714]|nr:hypothetical protein STPH1_6283 [Streptomyces sp. OM5714]